MNKLLYLSIFILAGFSNSVHAQDTEVQSIEKLGGETLEDSRPDIGTANLYSNVANPDDLIAPMRRRALEVDGVDVPSSQSSLFFTPREIGLIAEAREGFVARVATEAEIARSQDPSQRPRGPREVALGGVLFVDNDEWTVWINKQKITPNRIPPEITDIKVGQDYVQIKWYDAYTNQIFPIKLRPQQRFNIDTRIFLPG